MDIIQNAADYLSNEIASLSGDKSIFYHISSLPMDLKLNLRLIMPFDSSPDENAILQHHANLPVPKECISDMVKHIFGSFVIWTSKL